MKDDAYAALFDEGKSKDKALSERRRLLSVRERELGELRASQVILLYWVKWDFIDCLSCRKMQPKCSRR